MMIDIKISRKPVDYSKAMRYLETRVNDVKKNKGNELIWILEHPSTYTSGTSANNNDIVDKKIKIFKTSRGGKITYHGPGQLIFYFVINLNNKKKDVRWFLKVVENSIISSLKYYNILAKNDKKNIGIWVNHGKELKKIAAIGLRIKKWIVYHGFSLNVKVNLNKYKKIIPCGIKDKGIVNLLDIKKQKYSKIRKLLINNFLKNLNS